MESKLRSWGNQGNDLKVTVLIIFKEVQAINKDGKIGRRVTKKHTAALNKLTAQQEASGLPAVWKDIYRLMECSSAACTDRGFSCWRNNEKHYKLDRDIMDRLVDCAEQGHKLETHADVPEGIREVIYIRKDEEKARRLRKRKASDPLPVTVRISCRGHSDDASADSAGESQLLQLDFPLPEDKAPVHYSRGLAPRSPTTIGRRLLS
ncbi:hypothetical protein SCUP234_07290 [Seiridium cupressi]